MPLMKNNLMITEAYIFPYKTGSESAKALSEATGFKRINRNGRSKFKGNADKVVINWGCSTVSEEVSKCRVINKPHAVALASNKLLCFRQLINLARIPEFTTSKNEVEAWLNAGNEVVARTKINGKGGEGIVLLNRGDAVVKAPLYTKYIPKKREYRVHVAIGKAVDIQRKARRTDLPDDQVNWKIRNMEGGFIFARNEALGEVPADVSNQAVKAVKGLGLDFGAVDVIYNEAQKKAYVLEINTAPGLSGETLNGYAERILNLVNNKKEEIDWSKYPTGVRDLHKFYLDLMDRQDRLANTYELWFKNNGYNELIVS